jgi:type I restriction enzyme M protein
MFVQTGHFIEGLGASSNDRATFHGQEKSDTNTKLARMNMVVHGLDASNIRQGNTFYDQIDGLIGQCDFVMANPPFNVDGVITSRIGNQVKPQGRLPFGLPGVNGKTGAISNANSLWIQYFYAYLNDGGRAGFVMASSASDAGNKDRDIREQLVRSGHVDVMMAIGNKFFYTRSLPCTLWFFDKGKPEDLADQVLMIDARNVYTVVSARSHVFTDEQLANLGAITWLYRGEREKFVALVGRYQRQADHWLAQLPACLAADADAIAQLAAPLQQFASHATLAQLNADQPDEVHVTAAQLDAFKVELRDAQAALKPDHKANPAQQLHALLQASAAARKAIAKTAPDKHDAQVKLQFTLDALAVQLKSAGKLLETRHKRWLKLLDSADKTLRARQSPAWDGKLPRELKRRLLAADEKKHEAPSVRDQAVQALKQAAYFIHQVHWLHSRFPDALYDDVPGLCKAVLIDGDGGIAANDWSLTPGRYVGVAVSAEGDEEDFEESLRAIHVELAELDDKAAGLAQRIGANFEALLG